MPYHFSLSEAQFKQKYQALLNFLKLHENTPFPDIKTAMNQLPHGHILKDLFVINAEGKSFLHLAAAEENLELITFLKENRHEINLLDFNKKTPLYDACEKLKIKSVNALLGYAADPNLGDSHLVSQTMRDNKQINYRGENIPLVATIKSEAAVSVSEFAIATGTSEDLLGLTDELATERVRARIVKSLLAKGADILLKTGPDDVSPFHRAIELKKLLVVNEIADVGGPEIFEQRNRDGEAALNLAVSYWEKDEKEDPIYQAEMEIEEQITDMIIEHAEAKLPSLLAIQESKFGNTAIHGAVICSNYKVLKKILSNGYRFDSLKNLSRQNYEGNTPIHEAIKEAWRGPKILLLLLSIAMPDDLAIVNHAGETARQMAERLLQEANSVKALVEKIEKTTKDLEDLIDRSDEIIDLDEIDVPAEVGLLLKAMRDLKASVSLDGKLSDENDELNLSTDIENFINELEKYDVDGWIDLAREQIESYEHAGYWVAQDAKLLLEKATTLNLQDVYIPETHYGNQPSLSESDANNLAVSVRKLLERYDQDEQLLAFSIDQADDLCPKVRGLLGSVKQLEFFQKAYHDSLIEVNQERYRAWKERQLQLPSSFPNLETVNPNLLNPPNYFDPTYNAAFQKYEEGYRKYIFEDNLEESTRLLETSVQLFKQGGYTQHFALAQAHRALATAYLTQNEHLDAQANSRLIEDNNEKAQQNLEDTIDIYLNLQDYIRLQHVYQSLAKIHITSELSVANYEQHNRNKLSLADSQEQLQGHLALAGLYRELRAQNFQSASFSMADLKMREFYHAHQAYKLTQGKLDNSAHVVLQREIGLGNNVNLGIYNIQQCVAVAGFNPLNGDVVMPHFDKASAPIAFGENLENNFPGNDLVNLFSSGGRDRGTLSNPNDPYSGLVSDNNIEFVFKQAYLKNIESSSDGNPDNGRFKFKATDVGVKPSPQGVVFDVQTQRWVHATPNRVDASIESRAVNFMLQRVNEDYVRPLNPVDFGQSVAERKINLDPNAVHALKTQYTHYYANAYFDNPQSEIWKADQILYPLEVVTNEMAAVPMPDFTTGLLTEFRANFMHSRYGYALHSNSFVTAERSNTLDVVERFQGLQMIDPDNFLGAQDMFRCLGSRRRRNAGPCTLDSEPLLEGLSELSESKQAEVLEHVATRNVGGTKQEEIARLVQKNKLSQHLQKVSDVSSKAMEGFFATDAAIDFFAGDRSKTAMYVNLKALDFVSKRAGRVGGVALNTYNTYADFKNLLQNSNDTAAWLRFASSGMQTSVDIGSFGLRVAEGMSESFAALEVSAAFEAAGGGVVTLLILADRFYESGKAVREEEDILRKDFSFGTKLTEFGRAVFGRFSKYQDKIDDIKEYENLIPQLQEFLKNHTDIKYFVSPAIVKTGERYSCRRTRTFQKGCTSIYTPIFDMVQNNSVNFSVKQTGFKLNDEIQDAFPDRQFTCLPTGNDISVSAEGAFRCEGAFALNSQNSTKTTAFFNLGEGNDQAIGFKNASNILIVNNGAKAYQGGDKPDLIILAGTHIVTASDQPAEMGGLHGGAGLDTLQLAEFKPEAPYIELNLLAGYMKYNNSELRVTGMERILGGAVPLGVIVACDTKALDTAPEGIIKNPDSIFIPSNSSCVYNLEMHLHAQMSVTSAAEKGHLLYKVSPSQGKGNVLVNLVANPQTPEVNSIHQIEFNATLADVKAIRFPDRLDEGFPRSLQLQFNQSLPEQPAENFNFVLHTPQFNTVSLRFSDGGKLKVGNKNLYYIHLDLQQPAREIIDYYAPLMKQHNLIGFFITGPNEHILIGHSQHEVMENNPNAFRTHLYGNGGEGVFVIKSGKTSLDLTHLPISRTDIYHVPGDTHTDTLDFSHIAQQAEKETNRTVQLYLVTPNAHNHLGDDLLLVLAIPGSGNSPRITPIATVGIPRAFHSSQHHWFKNHLHIILGDKNKPLQIAGRHKDLFLKPVPPVPLVLDEKQPITLVSVNNLEANSTLIIPQVSAAGAFFQHNQNNLIWTNTLINTNNTIKPFTLIIDHLSDLKGSLFVKFTDETNVLSNISAINATDFTEAQSARLASLRAAFLVNPQPALFSTTQSTNTSTIATGQNQYLSNDINANSLVNDTVDYSGEESNTINPLLRQRRAIFDDTASASATSSASALSNWMSVPRTIAAQLLKTTGEIFTMLRTPMDNLTAYLTDTQVSDASDSLQQTSLLGNKTAIADRNPMQEDIINQGQPLQSCVSLSIVDTDQGYSDGVSCKIPTGRINFFHNIPFNTAPQPFARPEASFANCKPVEWYGRPAVACEAEKVTAIITPDPQLPNALEYMNGLIMLVLLGLGITNNLNSPDSILEQSPPIELTKKQKNRWKNKLATLEKRLDMTINSTDEQTKNWIAIKLEDRKEELDLFLQKNKATKREITSFNKNLHALQEMLDEVGEDSQQVPPEPQLDNDRFARAANTVNYFQNTSLGFFASNQTVPCVPLSDQLTHAMPNLLR